MTKAGYTRDVDRGEKAILREIKKAKEKPYVKVGILGNAGTHKESGVPVVLYASVNEFGSVDGRVPERSFVRSTMDQHRDKLRAETKRQLALIIEGKQTVARALGLLGLQIQARIRKKITNLSSPPNAPSTIRRKGSSNPLIDTGQMRSSINYEVVENGILKGKLRA